MVKNKTLMFAQDVLKPQKKHNQTAILSGFFIPAVFSIFMLLFYFNYNFYILINSLIIISNTY